MQDADIDAPWRGRAKLRQQAFGGVLVGEAHAMHHDLERAAAERRRFRPAGENLDRLGQGQLFRDAGLGVVIAANDECCDSRLIEPPELVGEETRGLHRRLLAVVEIAGDDKCVNLFRKAEIDDGDERLPRRSPNQFGKFRVAQRQRRKRRIEVDVGRMDEAEGHG